MKKVWVFGDSTSDENKANPLNFQQSWVHFLRDELIGAECENVAVSGTTLKWYYHCEDFQRGKIDTNVPEDSRWHKILSKIEKDDLFILFVGGINDHGQIGFDAYYEKADGDYMLDDYFKIHENRDVFLYVGEGYGTHRYYTARCSVDEYAVLLAQMIEEVKQKGALPLLVRGTGKYYVRHNDDFDAFPSSHKYMEILPEVAKKTGVPYFDVGGEFDKGFKQIGYRAMMDNYFMTVSAVERLNKKYGREIVRKSDDNCHHNIEGAKKICDILVEMAKQSDYPLKKYLK